MPPSPAETLARDIVAQLQSAGHVAYYAGGCVRDRLMNRPPKDYDVATSALPDQVLQLFPKSQKVGVAFGVVLVRQKKVQVEVATFRADGAYSDGRHPDSVRFTNAQEDAGRRDFTCNGLFLDPLAHHGAGQLHDFVGGQADIQAKTLRAIGDAARRFAEDHLRMLRAIRFAARLEFTIEPATRAAITASQAKIATISRERIGEEIRMMLEHQNRVAAVENLATFPEMFIETFGFPPPQDAQFRDWPILSGLPEHASRPVVLFALLLDAKIPPEREAIAQLRKRLMLSNDETEQLTWLAANLPHLEAWEDLPKSALKRLMASSFFHPLETLYRADPANADELFALTECLEILREEGVAPAPFITGDTLQKLGAKPGPNFKLWLDQLYDRQLNGELTTPAQAIEAAKKLMTGDDRDIEVRR